MHCCSDANLTTVFALSVDRPVGHICVQESRHRTYRGRRTNQREERARRGPIVLPSCEILRDMGVTCARLRRADSATLGGCRTTHWLRAKQSRRIVGSMPTPPVVASKGWAWYGACVRPRRAVQILFVCTGNICRSPSAERLATAYAEQSGFHDLRFSSAGVRAVTGSPMHPSAALVLEGLGGDPTGFSAKQLTSRTASDADFIFTMTASHRDIVLERAPTRLRRTFTLSEIFWIASAGARTCADLADLRPQIPRQQQPDIADPIGRDLNTFQAVGAQIGAAIPRVVDLCRCLSLEMRSC
ncbi:protein-tyrosine-phosphatase [Mycobacterium sp. BK558]|nr:protein-tyrosine-phosphatase [Mycobacterium sp. BK558]